MNTIRIGGIASGFDTDQIVRDLMRIERMKVDKVYQQRQILEWQKEQFRSITNQIRAFRDTYFDILKPATNMMSPSVLKKITASSGDPELVAVTAGTGAKTGETTFQVLRSATAAQAQAAGVTSAIGSKEEISGPVAVVEGKNVIRITLNGISKEITVAAGEYEGPASLQSELQASIDEAFGEGRVTVNLAEGKLEFLPAYASDTLSLSSATYYASGSEIDQEDILALLNIRSGSVNRVNLTDNMGVVSEKLNLGPLAFDENNSFVFTINGREISVHKTDTLQTVINRINSSSAGVQASYSSFGDTLTFSATETGVGMITTDDGGGFFTALGLAPDLSGGVGEAGRVAVFKINGVEGSRTDNTFTIEGITYSIKQKVDEPSALITVSLAVDTDAVYDNIVKFVEDYNVLIDKINLKLNEERFSSFFPLTDEQKEAMSEKEIEKWEVKAQSGLLRREPALENMLRNMRRAIYDMVGDLHLSETGIETSRDFRDQGKLVLKNGGTDLREAIASDPEKIVQLFTSRSTIAYSPNLTPEQRQQRYNESGLAHRLSDILNDNIRITRDNNGRKGRLLERAGIEGDMTQYNSYFDKQITQLNKRADKFEEMLARTEQQYYRQFTAMEKALQQLYTQSDWLIMQINQGMFGGIR